MRSFTSCIVPQYLVDHCVNSILQGGDSAGAAEGRGGPEQRGGRHQGTPHQHRQRGGRRQAAGRGRRRRNSGVLRSWQRMIFPKPGKHPVRERPDMMS